MGPSEVAKAFVSRINAHDVSGLCGLMTEDHTFVDALEGTMTGRAAMQAGWQQYFQMIPDYWIRIDTVLEKGGVIALFGAAGGSYSKGEAGSAAAKWQIPAAWLAEVRGESVATWRVYADNLPLRQLMALEPR